MLYRIQSGRVNSFPDLIVSFNQENTSQGLASEIAVHSWNQNVYSLYLGRRSYPLVHTSAAHISLGVSVCIITLHISSISADAGWRNDNPDKTIFGAWHTIWHA